MYTQQDIDQIRDQLTRHVTYTVGVILRNILHDHAKEHYNKKNTPERYCKFMNDHTTSFEISHPQGTNYPHYYTMFSVISQHVKGDCIEECLDQAIEFEAMGGRPHIIWVPASYSDKMLVKQ